MISQSGTVQRVVSVKQILHIFVGMRKTEGEIGDGRLQIAHAMDEGHFEIVVHRFPARTNVQARPFFVSGHGAKDGQHSHFEQSCLSIQIHNVESNAFAETTANAEIKPRTIAVRFARSFAIAPCPNVEFDVVFRLRMADAARIRFVRRSVPSRRFVFR